MREAVMLQLEKFCYYQHLSLSGGRERPIFACRIVDIRGTRFHVLSRIQDAGLDFTGRTNFIAHHLVFTPEEIRQFPTPPLILRDWPGWVKSWTKEPQLLENEDWVELTALAGKTNVPAHTWQRVTGDAVNGYGLLEAHAGASFRVDDQADETILGLLAESLELLEVRDTRRDFRTAAWNYTFTTSMQEQDNPADFRWRCIHSDNPAANRFATPDCRALSAVRATKWTGEETAFARTGRQAPRFVAEPKDARITEDESARFTAKAEGVPNPTYQWFSVDRANNGQILSGETNPELAVSNPALGVTRYVVSATNSAGDAQSRVASLSVEQKLKLAQARVDAGSRATAKPAHYNVKSEEDIERQRRRLQAEKAQEIFQKRLRRNKILVTVLTIALIAGAGVFVWKKFASGKPPETPPVASNNKKERDNNFSALQLPVAVSLTNQSNLQQNTRQLVENKAEQTDPNQKHNFLANLPPPTAFPLPTGWTQMVIGKVTSATAEFIPSRFDLSAVAEGFFTNGDNILFVCKTNDGGEFEATVPKIDPASAVRRCGIMIREAQQTNSAFLFIGASLERIFVYRRDSKGHFIFSNPEIPQVNHGELLYLKFDQQVNLYTPAYSFDNQAWLFFTNFAIPATQQMLVGFALYSGDSSNKVYARFVDISPRMKPTKN